MRPLSDAFLIMLGNTERCLSSVAGTHHCVVLHDASSAPLQSLQSWALECVVLHLLRLFSPCCDLLHL